MKKLLLALSVAVLTQGVFAEVPQAITELSSEVSQGTIDATFTRTIKTHLIAAADCTFTKAEAHSLAYPASGRTNGQTAHHGRHEAILTNCTGRDGYFNISYTLESADGGRYTQNDAVYVPNQGVSVISGDSAFVWYYERVGTYNLRAITTITGLARDSTTSYANVSITN